MYPTRKAAAPEPHAAHGDRLPVRPEHRALQDRRGVAEVRIFRRLNKGEYIPTFVTGSETMPSLFVSVHREAGFMVIMEWALAGKSVVAGLAELGIAPHHYDDICS